MTIKQVLHDNQKILTQKKNVEIVVPLKYLTIFWRILDIPLTNCEVSLILTSANSATTNQVYREAEGDNPTTNAPVNAVFSITDTKLYVPAVTLWTEDDNKLLEKLKA